MTLLRRGGHGYVTTCAVKELLCSVNYFAQNTFDILDLAVGLISFK